MFVFVFQAHVPHGVRIAPTQNNRQQQPMPAHHYQNLYAAYGGSSVSAPNKGNAQRRRKKRSQAIASKRPPGLTPQPPLEVNGSKPSEQSDANGTMESLALASTKPIELPQNSNPGMSQ